MVTTGVDEVVGRLVKQKPEYSNESIRYNLGMVLSGEVPISPYRNKKGVNFQGTEKINLDEFILLAEGSEFDILIKMADSFKKLRNGELPVKAKYHNTNAWTDVRNYVKACYATDERKQVAALHFLACLRVFTIAHQN